MIEESDRVPRLAVLVSGGGSNLQSILDACASGRLSAQVAIVISNRSDAYGLKRAEAAGVRALTVPHADYPDRAAFEDALHAALVPEQPDLIVLAGFMRILSPDFVRHYPDRIVNIHPSLLPDYKGTDTHRRVLEAGETEHGASVHLVTSELDGGPVIRQARVPVHADDTPETLAARVLEQEHLLYPDALQQLIDGSVVAKDGQLEFRDSG